jgi:hypothetical protein
MTATLANGGPKNKRRALDFYPTPREVTVALLEYLKLPPSRIWEPACGAGAMSRVLEEHGHTVYSSDITPDCYGSGTTDFLTATPGRDFDAVITNPPFAGSEGFILKALQHAPIVAMLLKSQYWHAAKRRKLFKAHTPAYILPLTWRPDFMFGERGGAPTMDVLWTVWIKGIHAAQYHPLPKPEKAEPLSLFGRAA